VRRQVERRLRDECAVGDHGGAVDREGGELLQELRLARRPRLQHGDAGGVSALGDRRAALLPAAPGTGVGPGEDGDDLVVGGQEGLQRRDGGGRRTGEQEPQWGLTFTIGSGAGR
jgi:hypothetical protein